MIGAQPAISVPVGIHGDTSVTASSVFVPRIVLSAGANGPTAAPTATGYLWQDQAGRLMFRGPNGTTQLAA